jgi:hypothetical protein
MGRQIATAQPQVPLGVERKRLECEGKTITDPGQTVGESVT